MRTIPVFKAEGDVKGLAELIQSNSSIAYTVPLQKWQPDQNTQVSIANLIPEKIKAGMKDIDLYYTKSILVSSNWNKNDDVFGKAEVWAARHTPSHKPTNLDHDEKQLVGHITENWAVDNDGKLLPDDTTIDDLPDLYHIVNGAVIYTTWQDKALIDRTAALIKAIEEHKKFVSMECLFSNFGYAIISPEGKYYTLARSEETAWLTKHLRTYGGTGEYKGHKIGRFLLNITFSGKGYVDNPANENSVILNDVNSFQFSKASQKNPFSVNSGVLLSHAETTEPAKIIKENEMPDESMLKAQNDKLEAKVDELTKKLSEATDKLAKTSVAELETKVVASEKVAESLNKKIAELTEANEKLAKSLTDSEAKVVETTKAHAEIQTQLTEVKAAEKKTKRVASLVDGGVAKEDAEKKVELYASLTDEQFADISKDIVEAAKKKKDEKPADDKGAKAADASVSDAETDKDGEAAADDKTLEGAEANEQPNLTSTDENKEVELNKTRAALVDFVRSRGIGGQSNNDTDGE